MSRGSTPPSATRILICDDAASIRNLLHEVVDLAPGMCVVGEAANGAIAIREASRLQPDVIILDLAMPVLSGLDALPRLRRVVPDAKILVYSGFSMEVAADQAFALGADEYLAKGTPTAAIVAAIEQVVALRQ